LPLALTSRFKAGDSGKHCRPELAISCCEVDLTIYRENLCTGFGQGHKIIDCSEQAVQVDSNYDLKLASSRVLKQPRPGGAIGPRLGS
jgi:hypothetical protein